MPRIEKSCVAASRIDDRTWWRIIMPRRAFLTNTGGYIILETVPGDDAFSEWHQPDAAFRGANAALVRGYLKWRENQAGKPILADERGRGGKRRRIRRTGVALCQWLCSVPETPLKEFRKE